MNGTHEINIMRLMDGRRLGYAEYGDLRGWPLLFFHGTPGSRVMARFAAPQAKKLGVRLIAPERPGYGLSDFQPQRRLLDWAEDVAQLVEALNLERFALAGVSGGGPHVAACAWRMGDRVAAASIISGLAPADRMGQDLSRRQLLTTRLVRQTTMVKVVLGGLAWAVRRRPDLIIRSMGLVAPWQDRKIMSQPMVRQTQIDGVREAFRAGPQGTAQELDLFSRPWGFDAGEIKVPVFLWHGEADHIVPVKMGRYLAGQIPDCRARFIAGAGHLWIFEGYAEVFGALQSRA